VIAIGTGQGYRPCAMRRRGSSVIVLALAAAACAAAFASSGLSVQATLRVDPQPGAPAYGAGSVWVPSSATGFVDRVDPVSMKVVARIRSSTTRTTPKNQYFDSVAVAGTSVWHASDAGGGVVRIDARTNKVVKRIRVPGRPGAIAAGAPGVYVSLFQQPYVLRIDPRRNRIVRRVDLRAPVMGVAYGAGAVWAVTTAGPTVVKLDPRTLAVRKRISIRSDAPVGRGYFSAWWIAASPRAVCAGNMQQNLVTHIDAVSGRVAAQTRLGSGAQPFGLAADVDACWAVNDAAAFRVGRDGAIASAALPASEFSGIAAGGGAAWVTLASRGTLSKVAPQP
jgi:DNA-binding beta-propeller fold protein YncE